MIDWKSKVAACAVIVKGRRLFFQGIVAKPMPGRRDGYNLIPADGCVFAAWRIERNCSLPLLEKGLVVLAKPLERDGKKTRTMSERTAWSDAGRLQSEK